MTRLAPTFDLDADQLCALTSALPPSLRSRVEVIVHAHVPTFHTEHCVFARTLSKEIRTRTAATRTRHSLHLVDEHQQRHHVLADSGCRNTVFNAQPQSAAPYLGQLRNAGVSNLRIELTDQPGGVVGGWWSSTRRSRAATATPARRSSGCRRTSSTRRATGRGDGGHLQARRRARVEVAKDDGGRGARAARIGGAVGGAAGEAGRKRRG